MLCESSLRVSKACSVPIWKQYGTIIVCLHAHCAWTTPEQSPWFKPIVMDLVWVDQALTNLHSLSPIDTIETCDYCWAWNCLCYSIFCTTSTSQMQKLHGKLPVLSAYNLLRKTGARVFGHERVNERILFVCMCVKYYQLYLFLFVVAGLLNYLSKWCMLRVKYWMLS